MPGLRILNVNPRQAGPVSRWHQVLELAERTGFNAIWLNPFHRACALPFAEGGRQRLRSLYAIRDHHAIDEAVSCGDPREDLAALREVMAHARRLKLRVMVDLVLNHVALDHPLVAAESQQLRALQAEPGWHLVRAASGEIVALAAPGATVPLLFARNDALEATDFDGTTGYDNAQLNFASQEARRFFLGQPEAEVGFWKRLVDFYLELGIGGFRCDMAYRVPASWWQEIIDHARRREPDVVFLGETLGGKDLNLQLADAQLTSPEGPRPAFDLVMLSTSWWDMKAPWLQDEITVTHRIALHGGAGSPDNHDLEQTLAQQQLQALRTAYPPHGDRDEQAIQRVVAALCVRNYAVAAVVGSSVYATLGYLFCLDQTTVFWDPELLERLERDQAARQDLSHPLNLRRPISAINGFLRCLPLARARVALASPPRAHDPGGDDLVGFEVLLHELTSGDELGRIAVAVDRRHEAGRLAPSTDLAAETAALVEVLRQVWPDAATARGGALWSAPPPWAARDADQREGPALAWQRRSADGAVWLETPLLLACFVASPPPASDAVIRQEPFPGQERA
ncbi:MAG: hypothetical protein IPI49_24035 [Myxococcales bacterium]|nr:hypothetical protein [Myxococcales bacterium]